ncbi:hypothetical protein SEPCBS119000_006372 [Sporothrix epigloea]|uniref:Uncharacterized protein n=1 Tax=Sporothrix epigloea TaxID=1892477 RepID=A0ABP0E5Z4_9PEZI
MFEDQLSGVAATNNAAAVPAQPDESQSGESSSAYNTPSTTEQHEDSSHEQIDDDEDDKDESGDSIKSLLKAVADMKSKQTKILADLAASTSALRSVTVQFVQAQNSTPDLSQVSDTEPCGTEAVDSDVETIPPVIKDKTEAADVIVAQSLEATNSYWQYRREARQWDCLPYNVYDTARPSTAMIRLVFPTLIDPSQRINEEFASSWIPPDEHRLPDFSQPDDKLLASKLDEAQYEMMHNFVPMSRWGSFIALNTDYGSARATNYFRPGTSWDLCVFAMITQDCGLRNYARYREEEIAVNSVVPSGNLLEQLNKLTASYERAPLIYINSCSRLQMYLSTLDRWGPLVPEDLRTEIMVMPIGDWYCPDKYLSVLRQVSTQCRITYQKLQRLHDFNKRYFEPQEALQNSAAVRDVDHGDGTRNISRSKQSRTDKMHDEPSPLPVSSKKPQKENKGDLNAFISEEIWN